MASKTIDVITEQKCALYVRVSTLYQIDKDSLPFQREDLANYCKFALGINNYEIFEDAGYSAKNTDRPAFQRMMSRLRTGEFSHLVVWKIDRISRNLMDFAQMHAELKKLGVSFISKNEQFDTSSAIGEAILKIILVFAELERKLTSERVTAVMLSRAEKGLWNGGRVPFGYNYDKATKTFSPHIQESYLVKKMFDMYEQTKSLLITSQQLNESKNFTRKGAEWSPVTVSIVLKNPFYIGCYRYNYYEQVNGNRASTTRPEKEWVLVPDHHEAIISTEQFERVSNILTKNNRSERKTYARKHTHVFAGLLQCGACGSAMAATIGSIRANGYRPSIYLCSRHRRFSDCPNKYISDATLGGFVFNYIANVLKAQNNFGRTTSVEAFGKKLLRGPALSKVVSIESNGLAEMYNMLRSGKFQTDIYFADYTSSEPDIETTERDILAAEKRKQERAMERLKSLYLYGDSDMAEKDFIIASKDIANEILSIDTRLEQLEKNSSQHFSVSDEELISKASYFIMTQQLQDRREINYTALIQKIEPEILKNFINAVVQKVVVLDGKIALIRFKNGIEHKFSY